jgi:chemotaxis signal transduction protein
MIYFDTGENSALLGGFSKVLRPDGLFLTGPVDYFPRFHDFFDTQKLEGTHVYRHRTAIKIPSNEHCIASVAKPAASNDRVNGDARSHPVRQIETPAASEPQQPDDPLRGALRAKLFRERSICLASRKIPLPAPETMEKLLVLRIGAETLCLRISRAAAVFQANAIALVPGAASSIAGLQMWRGHIMTLIDLAALLGIPDNPAKAPDRIAIELRELSPRAALLVDAIEGTVELDLALLEPASGSAPGSNFMLGRAERQHFIIDDDAMVAALPTGRHDHRAD